jgi:UDP-glucuronate 4-epimerase
MPGKIIVTGAAGFIGSAICKRLLEEGENVVGIDNLNNYYDVNLKYARLQELNGSSWKFHQLDICETDSLQELIAEHRPTDIVHMAAQAGVRYSIENPRCYLDTNIIGFGNILEACRNNNIEHLVYASSSSVYGGNKSLPFREDQDVSHPVSLYAATKKANELMAHSYCHLYNIAATGLRFFTVYGPWGRPDMAPMLFADAILRKKPIRVFNNGNMQRDFTYIDDIVEGVCKVLRKPPVEDSCLTKERLTPANSWARHQVFNIGNSQSIPLLEFINKLESALEMEAWKLFEPMQAGDVQETAADTSALEAWVGFKPSTTIEEGLHVFTNWYRDYYRL